MVLLINRPQPIQRQMRIHLRRRDIRMPQQSLYASEIGAAFDEMRRKGMAEHMRRKFFRIDIGLECERLKQLMTAAACEVTLPAP